jgi:hypothetical protein
VELSKENSWKEKKEEGDIFENSSVLDINKKRGLHLFVDSPNKKFEYWDLIDKYIPSITIECKNDERGFDTNNICIEVGCDGKLSGLRVTEAKYWLISGGTRIFLILTTTLKKLVIEEYDNKLKRVIDGIDDVLDVNGIRYDVKYPVKQGDGTTKYMNWYLIPQKFFAGFCLEVADRNKMTYEKLI